MKAKNLLLTVFLFRALTLCQIAQAEFPNGLCLIKIRGLLGNSYATGFLIGSKVMTSAFALTQPTTLQYGDIFCIQDDELVQIQVTEPVVHPEFKTGTWPDTVKKRELGWGYFPVTDSYHFKTDFTLPQMQSTGDFVDLADEIYGENEEMIVSMAMSWADDSETPTLHSDQFQFDNLNFTTIGRSESGTISLESAEGEIDHLMLHVTGLRNALYTQTMGGPVVFRPPNSNKLLAVGVVTGQQATLTDSSGKSTPALEIASTMQLHRWLNQEPSDCVVSLTKFKKK